MIRSRVHNLLTAIGFVLIFVALSQETVAGTDNRADDIPKPAVIRVVYDMQDKPLATPGLTQAGLPATLPVLPSPAQDSEPTVVPTATPVVRPAAPQIPVRIIIPAIGLDAPVVRAKIETTKVRGREVQQWLAPREFAAGWHTSSARLGEPGNTVLNGHHNVHGEVFGRLVDLAAGDRIEVDSDAGRFIYVITNHMIVPEKYEGFDVRMENARWILPSDDERLTLITCWPYESNTHRLIIVATPLTYERLEE